MERRQLVAGIGTFTLVGLAGCADTGDEDGPEDEGMEDEEPDVDEDESVDTEEDTDDQEEQEEEDPEEVDEGDGGEGFQVRIIYDGEWSGAAGAEGSTSSIQGEGEETIDIDDDDAMIISANAQKQDDSDDELTIQILEGGEVVAEESTTAEFGVAQVTYDTF